MTGPGEVVDEVAGRRRARAGVRRGVAELEPRDVVPGRCARAGSRRRSGST